MVIFRPNLQSQPLYTFSIFLLKKGSVDPIKEGDLLAEIKLTTEQNI